MNPTRYVLMSGEGFHCWNLVEIVFADELGIILPSYDPVCVRQDRSDPMLAQLASVLVEAVRTQWVRVHNPEEFDVIESELLGYPHIGIYIGNDNVLHKPDKSVRVDNLRSKTWNQNILGYYRHPLMT